jgi:hypothetical protein
MTSTSETSIDVAKMRVLWTDETPLARWEGDEAQDATWTTRYVVRALRTALQPAEPENKDDEVNLLRTLLRATLRGMGVPTDEEITTDALPRRAHAAVHLARLVAFCYHVPTPWAIEPTGSLQPHHVEAPGDQEVRDAWLETYRALLVRRGARVDDVTVHGVLRNVPELGLEVDEAGYIRLSAPVKEALDAYATGERLLCMLAHTDRENLDDAQWRDACIAAYCAPAHCDEVCCYLASELALEVAACCQTGHTACASSPYGNLGFIDDVARPTPALFNPVCLRMLLDDEVVAFARANVRCVQTK